MMQPFVIKEIWKTLFLKQLGVKLLGATPHLDGMTFSAFVITTPLSEHNLEEILKIVEYRGDFLC